MGAELDPHDFCDKCTKERFEAVLLETDGDLTKVAIVPKEKRAGRHPCMRIIEKDGDGKKLSDVCLRPGAVRKLSAATLKYYQNT